MPVEMVRKVGEAGETGGRADFDAEEDSGPVAVPVQVPVEVWVEQARSQGLGGYAVETLRAMFRYYDAFGLRWNPTVLAGLLGRQPQGMAGYLGALDCSERRFAQV